MGRSCLWVFLVAVVMMVASVPRSQAESKEEMIKAADALDKAFLAAFNKGDVDAISACYWNSPDVVAFPPDAMVTRGMMELKKGYTNTLAAMAGGKLEITESHQMPFTDVVVGWGLWRFTMPGPDGAVMTGRYTDVKAKRDGKWVYLVDHASAPMMSESEE